MRKLSGSLFRYAYWLGAFLSERVWSPGWLCSVTPQSFYTSDSSQKIQSWIIWCWIICKSLVVNIMFMENCLMGMNTFSSHFKFRWVWRQIFGDLSIQKLSICQYRKQYRKSCVSSWASGPLLSYRHHESCSSFAFPWALGNSEPNLFVSQCLYRSSWMSFECLDIILYYIILHSFLTLSIIFSTFLLSVAPFPHLY